MVEVPKVWNMFINGEEVSSSSGKTFKVYNPAKNELLAEVAEANEQDIDRAVSAARTAFNTWSEIPPAERSKLLFKLADLLESKADEFAELETLNTGKPINESKFIDLPMAIDCLRFYASVPRLIMGNVMPVPGHLNYTLREPIGVVGAIVPWNFPLMMGMWKIAPALAAGNTVVFKPAEQTPLSILKFASLTKQAGLPDGVFNVVPGYGETTGASLVKHPGIDKIAFTGSTETGKLIMQNASLTLKRISLELGGKSPNIVFEDADIDQAVNAATFAIFFNQGEVCVAGSRLFLHEKIYDTFMEKFIAKVKSLRMGDPMSPNTQVGAIVCKEQFDKVYNYINIGKEEGAKLICGGEVKSDNGLFICPTIFCEVTNDMKIAQEEIFGPVVAVIKFKTDEEAVGMANNVAYGLASAVWTKDIKRAHNIAKKLKAGFVWINTYAVIPSEAPFGGYKQSGFGRDLGLIGLEQYTEVKNVCVDLNPEFMVNRWYG